MSGQRGKTRLETSNALFVSSMNQTGSNFKHLGAVSQTGVCKGRLGKQVGFTHYFLMIALWVFLLVFLFIDDLESWATYLYMSRAEGPQGLVLPQSIPPSRSEEYLLMPSSRVCQRAKPYLIILVASAPANRKARQAIRDTWGGEVQVRGHRVMTLFMLGQPSDPVLGKELIEESNERGDLIQGRFIDSYGNLTLKSLNMLGWARSFCPQARFLAKVDDDVLFNPSALLQYLDLSFKMTKDEHANLYLGRVHMQVAPDRNPDSRHFMPESAFSGTVLPDYCSGTAYVLSRPAVLKLSLAAVTMSLTKPLIPEDVFMGICAYRAGITPTHSPFFSGGPAVPYGRCCYQTMVSVHHTSPGNMLRYWTEVHSTPLCSWLGVRTSLSVCKMRVLFGTLLRKMSI